VIVQPLALRATVQEEPVVAPFLKSVNVKVLVELVLLIVNTRLLMSVAFARVAWQPPPAVVTGVQALLIDP
jgi:hypothetical protein